MEIRVKTLADPDKAKLCGSGIRNNAVRCTVYSLYTVIICTILYIMHDSGFFFKHCSSVQKKLKQPNFFGGHIFGEILPSAQTFYTMTQ